MRVCNQASTCQFHECMHAVPHANHMDCPLYETCEAMDTVAACVDAKLQPFWMIIKESNSGNNSTRIKHYNIHKARAEAERLAEKEGVVFILLEAVAVVKQQKAPTVWEEVNKAPFC